VFHSYIIFAVLTLKTNTNVVDLLIIKFFLSNSKFYLINSYCQHIHVVQMF